jgi:hypothetical protein
LLVVILGLRLLTFYVSNEKLEDIIINQNTYVEDFDKQIGYASKRLKEIDQKGIFEGDDEIGWFFTQIKVIQDSISKFKTDNNNGTN